MVINGRALFLVLLLLAVWFAFLCRTLWKLVRASSLGSEPKMRGYATLVGIGCAAIAVGALLALHLSWISTEMSQRLGLKAIRIMSLLLFWPTLAGLLLSTGGRGRIRFLGIATCLITGLWWFSLSVGAAISMGAAPMARHPTRYLIPEAYVGWVKIKHGEDAGPLEMSNGKYICRIPVNGTLYTSSRPEDGWAKDEYFYYSGSGSLRELPETGWGKGGMIWAGHSEFQATQGGSMPARFTEVFYVGTEEQYHRNESHSGESLQPKDSAFSGGRQPDHY